MENNKNFKQILKKFIYQFSYDQYDEYLNNNISDIIFKKFFKHPIKNIYYWKNENDYNEIFAIFEYNKIFIKLHIYNVNDFLEDVDTVEFLNKQLINIFNNYSEIYTSIDDIQLSEFVNPYLKQNFKLFKNSRGFLF